MQYLEYYKPTVKKNKRQDIFVLYFLPLEWSEAPSWSRTPSETASRQSVRKQTAMLIFPHPFFSPSPNRGGNRETTECCP